MEIHNIFTPRERKKTENSQKVDYLLYIIKKITSKNSRLTIQVQF